MENSNDLLATKELTHRVFIKWLFLSVSLLAFAMPAKSQLKVYYEDHGESFEATGYVLSDEDRFVQIRDETGAEFSIPRIFIKKRIQLKTRFTTIEGNNYSRHVYKIDSSYFYLKPEKNLSPKCSLSDIANSEIIDGYNSDYMSFGLTLGPPSILNVVCAYQTDFLLNFGVQGGYGFSSAGGLFFCGINLGRSYVFEQNIAACGGYSGSPGFAANNPKPEFFAGFMYNINIYNFFVEIGYTYSGKSKQMLLFQVGLVYRVFGLY